MSYYSEMAAKIAEIDKRLAATLRAKDEEIASLKQQLNTVLEGTVSLRSYENTLEELDAATEVTEAIVAERDALVAEMGKLREENKELRRKYAKVKGLLINESKTVDAFVEKNAELSKSLEASTSWERYFQNHLDNARRAADTLQRKVDVLVIENNQLKDAEGTLKNTIGEWQREAARANEHADKMQAAWQAASKEASEYTEEIISLRNELAGYRASTKGLTLDDIRLALRFKTMYTQQEEFERRYDGYEDMMKVSFVVYPDSTPLQENGLWKFLRYNL